MYRKTNNTVCTHALTSAIFALTNRRRTWNNHKTEIADSILENKAKEFCESLNQVLDISLVRKIIDYLFHIPKKSVIKLREFYYKLVFSDEFEHDATFYLLHYILCDLFMYEPEPFVLP